MALNQPFDPFAVPAPAPASSAAEPFNPFDSPKASEAPDVVRKRRFFPATDFQHVWQTIFDPFSTGPSSESADPFAAADSDPFATSASADNDDPSAPAPKASSLFKNKQGETTQPSRRVKRASSIRKEVRCGIRS